ncbi:MAG: sugar phosphate isomerase/epimerase [Rhodospirillales bacterium]|nr:sugar phosphate isomerase/epimerase [Rhodospirillales bacterium]
MSPSMATVSLGGPLRERLQAIAGAGFQAVELFDTDLDGFDGTVAELGRLIDNLGLNLASYFPLRNFEGMPASQRADALQRAARYLDTAAELGADMVMLCSNTAPECLNDQARIAADLHELGQLATDRHLKLAYEALAWGRHVNDYRLAAELICAAGHPGLGLVLDSFHILARQLAPTAIRDIPGAHIFLVQISDAPMLDLDYLNWSRQHRVLPGQGEFDLQRFVGDVQQTGFSGTVSLECFNPAMQAAPPGPLAKTGFHVLNQLWGRPPAAGGGSYG